MHIWYYDSFRIFVSSHFDCPTLTILRVVKAYSLTVTILAFGYIDGYRFCLSLSHMGVTMGEPALRER